MNIKKGDILKSKDGAYTRKVLAICDGLYALSIANSYDNYNDLYTEKNIKDTFDIPEEKWGQKWQRNITISQVRDL